MEIALWLRSRSAWVWDPLRTLFRVPLRVFMSEDEATALRAALDGLERPIHVLEWGSGGSTVRFSRALRTGSTWLAVEHQGPWAERVCRELASRGAPTARVVFVGPNGDHAEGRGDGDEATFRDYVAYPTQLERRFDAVLVDGRARSACVQVGWRLLAPGGFVMLHDAQRHAYAGAQPPGSHRVRLHDPRRQVDGGDMEMHFFFSSPEDADRLACTLRSRLSPVVTVLRD